MNRRIAEHFAPLTRTVSDLLRQVTPAANDLWAYLRQQHRPEVPFIVRLKEVAIELGYTAKWLRNALNELVSLKLIQKLEQWWGQTYRLMLQPLELSQEISEPDKGNWNKNGDRGQKTSNVAPSNPHSSVPIQRDLKEIEHDDVLVNRKEIWYKQKVLEPEPNPNTEPLERVIATAQRVEVSDSEALFQAVVQLAPGFNPKVFAGVLAQFGETRIRHAITAISEQIARGNAHNPAGLLLAAIRRGFTANQLKRGRRQVEGKGGGDAIAERVDEAGEAWYLPGTTEVFVAPDEERSRLAQETERREEEFQRSVQMRAVEEDVSQLLVEISIALRESGLSRERVKELLEERYEARSQQYLDTEQLRDWLKFLCSSMFSIVPRSIDTESVIEQRN